MSLTASAFDTLELKDVGRSFGGREALADLNLTIRAGEFIALLGPSGCGKSTALNCLAGLLPLTHGEILIDGKRIDVLPSEKRDFGMVFQNYALFPHLSVAKNVAFGLEVRGVAKAEIKRRVSEAIALVKLEEHAKKLPGQLSGGQQQRVAIARAVVLEPRIVLMDEPLSNLDAKLRLDMRTEIRRLHQSLGLTTVYVTHDQEEALSLADRLVVLREGRVQQIGTPTELHNNPANWHVADFMGYRNLLDMELTEVSGSEARVSGHGLSLAATLAQPAKPGDTVRMAMRPHDLNVVNDHTVTTGRNVFTATVGVVEYQGREFAVEVTTSTGQRLFVHAETAPRVGEEVTLVLDPARALVYQQNLDAGVSEEEREHQELAEVGS
ncbi:ABC transporter ATP-binding protein [Cryobacterium tepidiphilum]|uniref:ABC transporter ATP-binding protein n=1 Tax=Cryobacterium tepidiphilum TaxID=2486026 RepID=A0A3M8LCR2_9MICO|nr:ABC transporter ATP-binding protein [Cryobacterium tepidiphilum]RNE62582.1 ABC transporter ATP-binding protein [Cryobacterium tepidiphilum]